MFRLLLISCLFFSLASYGQKPDYILLKKRNNRTLKAYFPGVFISGLTYDGFGLNGIIKQIKNDTVFVEQQDVRQMMSQFGLPVLDTVVYTIGIFYKDIQTFNYASNTGTGGASRRRGFAQVALPRILIIGGIGYLALETVNTIYRKESFNDNGTLTNMAVAAALAGTGYLLTRLERRSQEAGGKFRVIYMKMN